MFSFEVFSTGFIPTENDLLSFLPLHEHFWSFFFCFPHTFTLCKVSGFAISYGYNRSSQYTHSPYAVINLFLPSLKKCLLQIWTTCWTKIYWQKSNSFYLFRYKKIKITKSLLVFIFYNHNSLSSRYYELPGLVLLVNILIQRSWLKLNLLRLLINSSVETFWVPLTSLTSEGPFKSWNLLRNTSQSSSFNFGVRFCPFRARAVLGIYARLPRYPRLQYFNKMH